MLIKREFNSTILYIYYEFCSLIDRMFVCGNVYRFLNILKLEGEKEKRKKNIINKIN